MWEGRFSSYTLTKTTYQSRLSAELYMRIQLSSVQPYSKQIWKKSEHHFLKYFSPLVPKIEPRTLYMLDKCSTT
jgi:hypothetical protein